MLNSQEVRLGSKHVWLFGRIFSFLILVPPTISFMDRLIPVNGFVAVLFGWLLVMFLMRGWSYGRADSQRIIYVAWMRQKSVSWDEVSGIHTDSLGIRIKLKNRQLLAGVLHFNRLGFALTPQSTRKREASMEVLQRWWLDRPSSQLNPEVST
jgi:hypothetical protein